MEKIDTLEDLQMELKDHCMFYAGEPIADSTCMALLMIVKRLDSIDKTLSDLVYKKEN